MKYRSKPVTIEAFEFTGVDSGHKMIEAWGEDFEKLALFNPEAEQMGIENPAGLVRVNKGDFVIKATDTDFYPCPPDIFHKRWQSLEMEYIKETKNDCPN